MRRTPRGEERSTFFFIIISSNDLLLHFSLDVHVDAHDLVARDIGSEIAITPRVQRAPSEKSALISIS